MTVRLHAGELIIFGLDCTGSMLTKDVIDAPGQSRFTYAKERIKGALEMLREAKETERKASADPIYIWGFNPFVIGFGAAPETRMIPIAGSPVDFDAQPYLDPFDADHALTNLHELIFVAHAIRCDHNAAQTTLIVFLDGIPSEQAAAIAALHMALDEPEKRFEVHFLTVGEPEPSLTAWLASLTDRLGASSVRVLTQRAETMGFSYAPVSATQDAEQRAQAAGKHATEPPRVRTPDGKLNDDYAHAHDFGKRVNKPESAAAPPSSAPPTTPPRSGRRPTR